MTAFRQGLNEIGFVESHKVVIEFRSAEDRHDRLPGLVADLVRRPVSVIVGNAVAAVAARPQPRRYRSCSRSGATRSGKAWSPASTGRQQRHGRALFGAVLGAKRLELLRQLMPKATTMGVLVQPNISSTEAERSDVLAAAQAVGQQLIVLDATSSRDIEAAFATFVQRGAGALLVGAGAFMNSNRERVVALATRHKLPAIYAWREAVVAGGLMSYGTSQSEAYRQGGIYTGRMLKGEKPADLPVMQSTKFEFVINLKTAKALGLKFPALLARADEVIE